ncbi:hypothetical protein AB0M50_35450 [Nonomuraea fuscirosea]|uniref:hypothetical protein n=1 Tax=Nonomuraea fuscirosea TaxID=1291556 RepID=UPI0034396964
MHRRLFAGLAVCGGLFAVPGMAGAPALAATQKASTQSAAVTFEAEAWEYAGRFATLTACRTEGREWVRRQWAYQYKCVGGPAYSYYNLWVIPA